MWLLNDSFSAVGKDLVSVPVSQGYGFTEEIQRFPFLLLFFDTVLVVWILLLFSASPPAI